jgi:hypothetical protein
VGPKASLNFLPLPRIEPQIIQPVVSILTGLYRLPSLTAAILKLKAFKINVFDETASENKMSVHSVTSVLMDARMRLVASTQIV